MTELLVIIACYSGKGCTETLAQYREVNPQIKEIIYNAETKARKNIPPFAIQYAGPVVAFAVGMEGNITLSKHIGLEFKKDRQILNFKKDF